MEKEFEKYLEQSEVLRPGYTESLTAPDRDWVLILNRIMNSIPDLFRVIYGRMSGTRYEIREQQFMDFIPGYLLIHIMEYEKSYNQLRSMLNNRNIKRTFYPVLRNYSSDLIVLDADSQEIYQIFHDDDEVYLIHKNSMNFLKTINAFYSEKVYFVDGDGYLDYDSALEYEIGAINNPGIEYWEE